MDFEDTPAFYRTHLDEEQEQRQKKEKRRTITVSINAKEEEQLLDMKRLLNIGMEGKALKICAKVGLNVLLNTFGEKNLRYLFKKERVKESDKN